jgi:hypothetical protein
MSARADMCGGRSAMIVPTATSLSFGLVPRCRQLSGDPAGMVGKQEVTSSNLSNTGAHSLEQSSQPTDTEEQPANQPFSRNGYKMVTVTKEKANRFGLAFL